MLLLHQSGLLLNNLLSELRFLKDDLHSLNKLELNLNKSVPSLNKYESSLNLSDNNLKLSSPVLRLLPSLPQSELICSQVLSFLTSSEFRLLHSDH